MVLDWHAHLGAVRPGAGVSRNFDCDSIVWKNCIADIIILLGYLICHSSISSTELGRIGALSREASTSDSSLTINSWLCPRQSY